MGGEDLERPDNRRGVFSTLKLRLQLGWQTFGSRGLPARLLRVISRVLAAVGLFFAGTLLVWCFSSSVLQRHDDVDETKLDWSADELPCSDSFHIPAVALLFLVKSSFPLESVWREWFMAARCAVPADTLARYARCGKQQQQEAILGLQALLQQCGVDIADNDLLAQTPLFSVYVHSSINLKPCLGFPGSMLDGREVAPRVETDWGQHSVVDAMLSVLRAALKEKRNRRFVFVSESTVPLYPPSMTYLQMMREPRSRVYTCPLGSLTRRVNAGRFYVHDFSDRRWHPGMELNNFTREHWRKSPQWTMLTRKHAQLISDDVHVRPVFERHCSMGDWDPEMRRESECVSDEHYIPSLLVSHGLAHETNSHALTWVHWRIGESHPVEFSARRSTPQLMEHLRAGWKGCDGGAALVVANKLVVHATVISSVSLLKLFQDARASYDPALMSACPLFARKFAPRAAAQLEASLAPCYHASPDGLDVNGDEACPAQQHQSLAGLNVFELLDWKVTNYVLRGPCHL